MCSSVSTYNIWIRIGGEREGREGGREGGRGERKREREREREGVRGGGREGESAKGEYVQTGAYEHSYSPGTNNTSMYVLEL